MAQPPHTDGEMRGFYPVCQVTELAAGYRDTTRYDTIVTSIEYCIDIEKES